MHSEGPQGAQEYPNLQYVGRYKGGPMQFNGCRASCPADQVDPAGPLNETDAHWLRLHLPFLKSPSWMVCPRLGVPKNQSNSKEGDLFWSGFL